MSRRSIAPDGSYLLEEIDQTAIFEYQEEETEWFNRNIMKRECAVYIPCTVSDYVGDAKGPCQCGREYGGHTPDAIRNYDNLKEKVPQEWHISRHTSNFSTDAFGEIDFLQESEYMSKFARVDYETDIRSMLIMLTDLWELKKPNLVISVTGGMQKLHLTPSLKSGFKHGLMAAAASTGAWITTSGTASGVNNLVGEAIHDHLVIHGANKQLVVIGIAAWGTIHKKEGLINSNGCWPAEYQSLVSDHRREFPLEPNHSHFIFVDDGTEHLYTPAEANFRAKLDAGITKIDSYLSVMGDDKIQNIEKNSTVVGIEPASVGDYEVEGALVQKAKFTAVLAATTPLVLVVMDGGLGTFDTVYSALQYKTPVILVIGSGRASDILAYAKQSCNVDSDGISGSFDESNMAGLKEVIIREFNADMFPVVYEKVQQCLKHYAYIHAVRIDKLGRGFDKAILETLLLTNKGNPAQQLHLAMALKRADIAKTHIFTDDKLWKHEELEDALYKSLFENKPAFTQLIMDTGMDLKRFLTIERLFRLYNQTSRRTLLHTLLCKQAGCRTTDATMFTLRHVGSVIKMLIGAFYKPLYLRNKKYRDFDPTTASQAEKGDFFPNSVAKVSNEKAKKDHVIHDFTDPSRELFIWAILLHRKKQALFFWKHGRLGIAGAVVAQGMVSSMMKLTDDTEILSELEDLLGVFEQHAVGVLGKCHLSNVKRCSLLLVREMPKYGFTTVIEMVAEASVNFTFVTHASVQALVSNVWMDYISPENKAWKLVLCILCPPLILKLIKFKEKDWRTVDELSSDDEQEDLNFDKEKTDDKRRSKVSLTTSKRSLAASRRSTASTRSKKKPTTNNERQARSRVTLTPFAKLYYFFQAPVTIFYLNAIYFEAFLLLFTHLMLTNFTNKITTVEIILYIVVFSIGMDEVRQLMTSGSNISIILKVQNYFSEVWNIIDMLSVVFFLVGSIVKYMDCSSCLEAARIIMALDLAVFLCKQLHIISIHRQLGPKLVMIGRMMYDLTYFMVILAIFITAYGIAVQVILYPNSDANYTLMSGIVSKAYFQIYGELSLDEMRGIVPSCSFDKAIYGNSSLSIDRCPEETWVTSAMLGIYILFTNVLMLNMLIAMFNSTFENVQTKTDLHWYFQRYFLTKEFARRSALPPPFILLSHLYLFFRKFVFKNCWEYVDQTDFKIKFSKAENKMLYLWERANNTVYIRRLEREERQQEETQSMHQKLEEVSVNTQQKMEEIDSKLISTMEALNWLMDSLKEQQLESKEDKPSLNITTSQKDNALSVPALVEADDEDPLFIDSTLHTQARIHLYPTNEARVMRVVVPDSKVPWAELWGSYKPVLFTEESILQAGPPNCDLDLIPLEPESRNKMMKFNCEDRTVGIDRGSYEGIIELVEGLPLNPMGRTGLQGRGALSRWGPNHCLHIIVTRWSRDQNNAIIRENGNNVLEFVALKRVDNGKWGIPWGMWPRGEDIQRALKSVFISNTMPATEEEGERHLDPNVLEMFDTMGEKIYEGYFDDSLNTDNAWLETSAWFFHDNDGHIVNTLPFKAGYLSENVCWVRVSDHSNIHSGHLEGLHKIAELKEAAF